ncbi:MAG: hypothetical protein ABFS17_14080, partial [Chloroflexota bacterium]
MNSQIRTIITDIKAAARIGHPESLWAALEGLLNLPQTLGNPPMTPAFIEKAILPVGEALASPRLNLALIQPLSDEPQAVLRASAAAALAFRYLNQDQITIKQLNKPAADSRQDVRLALQFGLSKTDDPLKIEPLIEQWLPASSPRLQALAISLLPHQPGQALARLAAQKINSDPDVRAALVGTLIALAQAGQAEDVLTLLAKWAADQDNHIWTICKTLAGSWAAKFPEQALDILSALIPQADNPKQIINTLQALHRHGAGEEVISTLKAWQQ